MYIINNMKKLINELSNKKIFIKALYILIFVIYILKPLCFDVKLYLEAAIRADAIGGFPNNIILAWEHKFILNRLIFYVIFKIAQIIVPIDKIILFEMAVKIIYGFISIGIIRYFAKNTISFFSKYGIKENTVFGVVYLIIIGSGTYFLLQTEMTALLIVLVAIVFVMKEKTTYQAIAAFIISMLFWLKGITLLYSIVVLVVMLLNNTKKSKIIFVITLSCIFLILELLLLYYFEPNEIEIMYLSTQYMNQSITFKSIIIFLIDCILTYQFLNIGFIVFVINIINHIKNKNIKLLILETLTWGVLLIGIFIQRMRYFYQIGLMSPAIILSIFIFCNSKIDIKNKLITIMSVWLILCKIPMEIYYIVKIHSETVRNSKNVIVLNEQIHDLKDSDILYIGNGLVNYYIKAKSYTNYVTTIFLNNSNEEYLNNSYINDLKNKIKGYTGKYIIIDEIEFLEKIRLSDDIIKFIEENYHYRQSTGIGIYEMGWGEYAAIYERNEE